jgi:hypothetical protein
LAVDALRRHQLIVECLPRDVGVLPEHAARAIADVRPVARRRK